MVDTIVAGLKSFWERRPLVAILLIALLPRLASTVWSKGYAMHDDHFGPIEQPFIIMHYPEYWTTRTTPHGHSIVYPTIHYALFNGLEAVGIEDPQTTMYVVRLLHALYSLLVVYFGFKIAELLGGLDAARKVGLILALLWALPFLSVRNLIEVICIPPLMAGSWFILKSGRPGRNAFIAGACFAMAFVFRYQTLAFTGTLGAILLFTRRFRDLGWLTAGFLVAALVVQGSADTFAWGYPFASFVEYVRYNASHPEDYTNGPWYNYLLLVLGVLIPPLSFFLLYGFIRNWRKTLLLTLPVVVFFVVHSSFPNKQERFIVPVVPLIVVLSVVGWEEYVRQSSFWLRHRTGLKAVWVWFWSVNVALLILFSTYYCKKTRVESMYWLYGKQVTALFQNGGKDGISQPPFFYGGKYPVLMADISSTQQLEYIKSQFAVSPVRPNYILFYGTDNYDERTHAIESTLGLRMELEKRFDPSFLDYVFYRLNPTHNKNETIFVFHAIYPGNQQVQ
ncbi:MAG TPA: hypothetical protein VMM37_05795 [Bacteroidota bacterium]|nr:hypothetical protein [Bacteroidota bacterium]